MKFSCPQCGKSLKVPDSMAGKRGKCPSCSETFLVPDPQTGTAGESGLDLVEDGAAEVRTCAFCRQPLAEDAVLCTHCGTDFKTGAQVRQSDGGGKRRALDFGGTQRIAIRVVVILGILAGGWFGYKYMTGTVRVAKIWELVYEGDLKQALTEFKELRSKISGSTAADVDLYIAQLELEMKTNVGEALLKGVPKNLGTIEIFLKKKDAIRGGLVMTVEVLNDGKKPLTLRKELFYLRGQRDIVAAATHDTNTLEGVTVPPGETVKGVVAFRKWPRFFVELPGPRGSTKKVYAIIFNDGRSYSKKTSVF
jgi:hypothetical protein